jgi:hypothetical protein
MTGRCGGASTAGWQDAAIRPGPGGWRRRRPVPAQADERRAGMPRFAGPRAPPAGGVGDEVVSVASGTATPHRPEHQRQQQHGGRHDGVAAAVAGRRRRRSGRAWLGNRLGRGGPSDPRSVGPARLPGCRLPGSTNQGEHHQARDRDRLHPDLHTSASGSWRGPAGARDRALDQAGRANSSPAGRPSSAHASWRWTLHRCPRLPASVASHAYFWIVPDLPAGRPVPG